MSLGTCSYAQIIQRSKAKIIFRNTCVHTQNTSMSLGTCSYTQIIQRSKAKIILGISAYVRRIHPCAEMIQITSSLVRIYAQTPILYLMDFFALYADNPQKQAYHAHISKKSTTGWFAPCAKTPNLDQYIPLSILILTLCQYLEYVCMIGTLYVYSS